jgi:hypothetical protein
MKNIFVNVDAEELMDIIQTAHSEYHHSSSKLFLVIEYPFRKFGG